MSTIIHIGPKQLLNPIAVKAQIDLEKTLGNQSTLQPTAWKNLLAAFESIESPDVLAGALEVMVLLIHNCRYNRGFDRTRRNISASFAKVVHLMTEEQVVPHLELMLCYNDASNLTAQQCEAFVKHGDTPGSNRHNHIQFQLDTLALRSTQIFQAPDAIRVVARRRSDHYNGFLQHVQSLRVAAEAIVPADQLDSSDVFWSAVRTYVEAKNNSDWPMEASDVAALMNCYHSRIWVEMTPGGFKIELRAKPREVLNVLES